MYDKYTSRSWTLTRNDLRADNLFRVRDKNAKEEEFTYIDWQLVAPGPVGPEFTQAGQFLP